MFRGRMGWGTRSIDRQGQEAGSSAFRRQIGVMASPYDVDLSGGRLDGFVSMARAVLEAGRLGLRLLDAPSELTGEEGEHLAGDRFDPAASATEDGRARIGCSDIGPAGQQVVLWANGFDAKDPRLQGLFTQLLAEAACRVREMRIIAQLRRAERMRDFAAALTDRLRDLRTPSGIVDDGVAALAGFLRVDRAGFGRVANGGHEVTFEPVYADGLEAVSGTFPTAAFGVPQQARPLRRPVCFPSDRSLTVPVLQQSRLVAILHLHRGPARSAWTDAEVSLATLVAERIVAETDRATAHAALGASETQLRTVLEGVTDAFFALDRDWRFTVFNRAAELFFDRSREEVIGCLLFDVVPAAKASSFEQSFARVMARAKPEAFSAVSVSRPDRHIACRVYPQAGGGVAACFNDVTEAYRLHVSLRDREAHLSALYTQSGVGLAETDLEGRFINANAEYCRIVGRTGVSISSLSMRDVTHEADLDLSNGLIDRLLSEGGSFSVEKRYLRADGDIIPVFNTISLITHGEKPPTTLVVSVDASRCGDFAPLEQRRPMLRAVGS